MESNVELLEGADRTSSVLSTRATFWPPSENQEERTRFRRTLSDLVQDGAHIERLWQIRSSADAERFIEFVDTYGDRPNISMAYIEGSAPLPELLVVDGRGSMSFPQKDDPERMVSALHFRRRRDVEYIEGYFEGLWKIAEKAKEGPRIREESLQKLKLNYDLN